MMSRHYGQKPLNSLDIFITFIIILTSFTKYLLMEKCYSGWPRWRTLGDSLYYSIFVCVCIWTSNVFKKNLGYMDFNQSFGVNISYTAIQWLRDRLFHSSKLVMLCFWKCEIAFNFFLYFLHLIKLLLRRKEMETCRYETWVWSQCGVSPLVSALSVHGGTQVSVAVPCRMRPPTNVVAILMLSVFEGKAMKEPYKVRSLCMRPGGTNIWQLKLEAKLE